MLFWRTTFLAMTICLLAFLAKREIKEQDAANSDLQKIAFVAPDSPPERSQASIDLAIQMYNIKIPSSADRPSYDPNLRDRGLTVRGSWFTRSTVTIGPAAFTSWALLGSTLGHELEIHCNQSFILISLMDALRLDGTGAAERQAYLYELVEARRYGLDAYDRKLILETVTTYYPEQPIETEHMRGTASALRLWIRN